MGNLILRFYEIWVRLYSRYKYIETKPIHESQKIVELKEEFGVFEIEVIPNYELEARLLSYGETVEVLEPEGFREKIAARVSNSLNLYSD